MDYIIIKALEFAARAHDGQKRKGTGCPYIVHPVEVGMILMQEGQDADTIAAGILHDTLEDTSTTKDELLSGFGQDVLDLVIGASEKLENRINTPWKERKEHTISIIKSLDERTKNVVCADKLSNVRSMEEDYKALGEDLWDCFSTKSREDQKWYYISLACALRTIENKSLYRQYCNMVEELFGSFNII